MKNVIKQLFPDFLLSWYYELWAILGALIYRFPSRHIRVIGVTGTNGKTSTVHLTSHILEKAGYKVASISSVRFKIGDKKWKNTLKMTMPGRLVVQMLLRKAVDAGCDVFILEVTSEGILARRHKYITFDTAVFTNLTPEHIEAHGSFELYKIAKGELFSSCGNIHIINVSDENADYFLQFPAKKIIRYEGIYMEANEAAARAIARSWGVSEHVIEESIANAPQTPGRMEVVVRDPFTVIVDYAHTPDALRKTYEAITTDYKLKPKNYRLVCVLGSAGGGRDKWKRSEMGKIAAEYCDEIILTNEDPYDEDPLDILHEIESGIQSYKLKPESYKLKTINYKLVPDRREAINLALKAANQGDVVIITGKGSESLMMTKEGSIPWDDRDVVREELPKLSSSQKQFTRAASILKLNDKDVGKLLRPHAVLQRSITVQMDDGTPRTFSSWRVQHSIARGPAKGGIRFHPDVSREEVQNLAAWMTWKTALLDLPLGGGKGGVAVNVPDLSDAEYERVARAYIRTFADVIGPNKDIPAPDVGTDERVMSWMMDEYSAIQGKQVLGVVTGKPIDKGGILGRREATGKGLLFVTKYILGARGSDLSGMRVSVQGFGNVGMHAALFFHEAGALVIRIGERTCTLENIDGIDVPALFKYKELHGGSIGDSEHGAVLEPIAVLTKATDILVPAAMGDAITEENASRIQADVIVEGANGPVTPEAEAILLDRGISIIPDILANAGGVVVSFFEWQHNQNPQLMPWSKSEVYTSLKERMDSASQHVLDMAKEHHTDLRTAAYIYAISKVL